MGSVKDDKEIMTKAFCDDVYVELGGMNLKLRTMIDELAMTYGEETEPFKTFKRHLLELADQIEWRLEILSHACPFDWKGSRENVESIVSVNQPEVMTGPEFSGGYLGG
jgi:hypothetical protein